MVATSGWPDGAATVVVASGADWVDALAAPAAAAADAPLLLAGRNELPAATIAALSALAGPSWPAVPLRSARRRSRSSRPPV